MTNTPNSVGDFATAEAEALLLMLRRKQGTWVEWGQACQQLQKAGYSPQAIFEETGFEPVQQNQVGVAAQVYAGLLQAQAAPEVLEHFNHRGSDILYELRILNQADRVAAAAFALHHRLDADEAHDITKAIKDVSRLSQLPSGFTAHPGDAVAYQCWNQARQKSDLQERSRLIARGLRFVHSESARKALEKLLTDFTVVKAATRPRMPLHQLESELDLPRIVPLAGKWPLTTEALTGVPALQAEGAFRLVRSEAAFACVPLPGWQVLMAATDPVAVLWHSEHLPLPDQRSEELLVVVDRAQQEWDVHSYVAVDAEGQVDVQWFAEAPAQPILGRVILVLRPKRILDESATQELWLLDE